MAMAWSSLERALLHDISLRLRTDADCINFRQTCRHWRAAVAGTGGPVPRPWLLAGSRGSYIFRCPPTRGRRRLNDITVDAAIPDSASRGASRGWLAVADGTSVVLKDPISRAQVPLPSFPSGHWLTSVFFSDDPLAASAGWTAFAFAWGRYSPYFHRLAFWCSGDDSWTLVDGDRTAYYESLEFYRGRAYLLDSNYVAVCDVDAKRLLYSRLLTPNAGRDIEARRSCLVECDGDLLLVTVSLRSDTSTYWGFLSFACGMAPRRRSRFTAEVYKVECAEHSGGAPVGYAKVDGIGEYAVFVSPKRHAFALPASGYPGVRRNCVYYAGSGWPTLDVDEVVVFDLGTRRVEETRYFQAAGERWLPVSWFCPRRPAMRPS